MTTQSPTAASRSLFRNPYVWFFFIGIITITAMRPLLRREPPPPEIGWQIPAFTLTDQSGRPFGSADLEGQVYVVNFFFTNCPSICPTLMEATARLQRRYEEAGVDRIPLISITVDPETDTPERLREYGELYGVDPDRWRLLTGEPAEIRELLEKGFKVAIGNPQAPGGGPYDIAHSGKLFIVDGQGWTRCVSSASGPRCGYGYDDLGLDEIFHRSQHVLERGSSAR